MQSYLYLTILCHKFLIPSDFFQAFRERLVYKAFINVNSSEEAPQTKPTRTSVQEERVEWTLPSRKR